MDKIFFIQMDGSCGACASRSWKPALCEVQNENFGYIATLFHTPKNDTNLQVFPELLSSLAVLEAQYLPKSQIQIKFKIANDQFIIRNFLTKHSGEGNGNLLQYSCLENSMDKGAWQAIVHGVTDWDISEHIIAFRCQLWGLNVDLMLQEFLWIKNKSPHRLWESANLLRSRGSLQRSFILIKNILDYNYNYEDLELCRNIIRDRDAGNKRAGHVEGTCSAFRKLNSRQLNTYKGLRLKGSYSGTQACQQEAARLPTLQVGWQDACLLGWSNELRINNQDKGSGKPQDWEERVVTVNCRC